MQRKLRIITADERMAQDKGVKALIVGPAGVGKTTLLRTLNPATTFFIDLEAGDLAVRDVPVDTMQPRTWEECRDLACYLGGPNPSLPPTACYSQAHYDAMVEVMGPADAITKYDTYFVDSITVAGRLCFRWCEQQPESFNDKGKKNLLGTYGLMGREMIGWLTHLQHTRDKNIIFVGILEYVRDEYNISTWELQIDGSKTGKELPGIVDEILTMQFVDFGDGQPVRALVCTQPNPWKFPAKDRSGKLDQIEEPHLGRLMAKIAADVPRHPVDHNLPQITSPEAA
ncbi:ATP-binding protein [Bradyrhizobium sp. USDA 4508]